MATTLLEVEQLAKELTPADQARLIQFLAPQVPASVPTTSAVEAIAAPTKAAEAWQRLTAIGRRLAASAQTGDGSITEAVSQMRR